MKASELKGRAVVALSEAVKIGHVDDVLFDAQYREVRGFRIKKGLLDQPEAVTRENVSAIGADAVTVPSPDVINVENRFEQLLGAASSSQAQGIRIVTEGGELLGTVEDLELDDGARTVTTYILFAPLLDRIRGREQRVQAQDVVRLGEGGIMIVPDTVAQTMQSST